MCPAGPAVPPPLPPWRLARPLCSPLLLLLSPAVPRSLDLVRLSRQCWTPVPQTAAAAPPPGLEGIWTFLIVDRADCWLG